MKTFKIVLATLGVLFVIGWISNAYTSNTVPVNGEKSIFKLDRTEYTNLAVKNCSTEYTETQCRCFYDKLMDEYGLDAVRQMDIDVTANENYQFTDRQLQLVAQCIQTNQSEEI